MEATRNSISSSLSIRQLALLETECRCALERSSSNLSSESQTRMSNLSGFSMTPFPGFKLFCDLAEQPGIYGSSALETPTVERVPTRTTPRYGPIGVERYAFLSSSPFMRIVAPQSPFVQIFHPIPRLPNVAPIDEILLQDFNDSGSLDEPSWIPSFEKSLDATFSFLGRDSPCSSRTISPPRSSSRIPTELPTSSHGTPVSVDEPSLFNYIASQLSQLDGTASMERRIWEQLAMLKFAGGISQYMPTVVECLVDQGITRGYPSNLHTAGFCAYFLERASFDWGVPGDGGSQMSYASEVRAAFFSIFRRSWTPSPKPGSLSSKLLIRVASFYGHLYTAGVLYEDDYRAYINFLSTLSPLPQEHLKALLAGKIEDHQELRI